jgi:DNA ligase-1
LIDFARAAEQIAQTPKKLEKIARLAAYLRDLDDADLAAATRFFSGDPFAAADGRSLAIGGRTIVAAATRAWGIAPDALRAGYRASGDLGAALGPLVRPSLDLGLFRTTLTPATLKARFDEIAAAAGPSAQRRRQHLLEGILSACTDPLEATYTIKIVTGDLRIGLKAGLIVDALAAAFERDPALVRRAAALAGDLGAVAIAARRDALGDIAPGYHAPIAFMLATPIPYGEAYPDLAGTAWLAEDKYDGIRLQAHVTPERVSLFSRTLSDVSAAFPEVAGALRARPGSFALDGELIAERDGAVLPFRFLQARLQRKTIDPDLAREVPVRYVVFDALARDAESLLDLPLAERRGVLAELLAGAESAQLSVAPWQTIPAGDDTAAAVNARFAAARERGHEGLVFKRSDAPYAPGRRGKGWLKLKRELATIDAVVVAVEWGHGRRAHVLSDYTFAVVGAAGLDVIGKAYSGLTDAEIAEMTVWFEAHRLAPAAARRAYERLELKRREIVVEPEIVVEIAFDIIQESALHASGFSLRFPRIVRLRPDKPAADADTLERVRAIYAEMLARERLPAPAS